ncbi:NACHT domain-containing protein [Acrocarpospora macrocephala]|uniref:NACHT domain-containing protein n=1 Tax=Acrocarpospora macrocephala TaxID=150177 RepID=UPI0031D27060
MPAESVSSLLPYGGALLALFVLLWIADKFTGGIVEELGKRLLDRLQAGPEHNLLKRRALKLYVAAVRKNYGTHTMGFRRDDAPIAVEEVYIPVRYESDGERLDVEERLRKADRAVVVGEPGAGKSMLLKHLMLEWTRDPRRDPSVPVLVDLHLYGTSGATLKDLVARALSHGKWQFTLKQLDAALGEGRLRLYFDGLDEVLRDRYAAALAELKDLAQRHHSCPMVVTCRDEVYDGELAAEFGPPMKVADLDDAALRLLLRHLLKDDERMESLFGALQANRPVLSLARSPMLLTMIAYLHLEGVFGERGERMPRSRSEFYEKAVAYLLRRDEARGLGQVTRHGPAIKLAILRKVALMLMSRQEADGRGDRRAITRRDLLAVIRAEGDDFNLDRAEADEVIREIVERSRLLIRLEGAEELYGFRHLTLQEYLAALELGKNWEELLQHYRRHPETWREVVRLWCGLVADDSAPLLRAIYTGESDEGRVLVVRCLAEATRVESAFADEVIGHFLGQLTSGVVLADSTVRALGALAGVGGPRGRTVLDTLLRMVGQAHPGAVGEPADRLPVPAPAIGEPWRQAIRVLAASGHSEAGAALTEQASLDPFARAELRSMGELAIPPLRKAAHRGLLWAIDDIGLIGTPAAAEALVPLLAPDSPAPESARLSAAWWLAVLLNSDDVRAVLDKDRRDEVVPGERLEWVVKPYRREWSPRLSSVVGRVAWLISEGIRADALGPLPPVTPLIALPLHAARLGSRGGERVVWSMDAITKKRMDELREHVPGVSVLAHVRGSPQESYAMLENVGLAALSGTVEPRVQVAAQALADRVIDKTVEGGASRQIIRALDWRVGLILVASFGARRCSRQDWEALAERTPEPRVLRLIRTIVWGLLAWCFAIAGSVRLWGTITGSWTFGPAWIAWIVAVATVVVIASVVIVVLEDMGKLSNDLLGGVSGFTMLFGGFIVASGFLIYGAVTTVAWLEPSIGTWAGWVVVVASAGLALLLGKAVSSKTRRFQNPFQRILGKCAPHLLPAPEEEA